MNVVSGLLPIYAMLTLGYSAGRVRRTDAARYVQIATLVLLFSVGVEASPALRAGAARLLGISAALGLSTGLASAALVWSISGRSEPIEASGSYGALGWTLATVSAVALGVLLSGRVPWASGLLMPSLYLLILLVGVDLASGWSPRELFRAAAKSLWIPAAAAAASLSSGWVLGSALGIGPRLSLAASAGFGWYSLAGPLMAASAGPQAGALGFFSNLMREISTVVLAPAVARLGPEALAAMGGATAMDTTLGPISVAGGRRATVHAIVTGSLLTLVAPGLVYLLASSPA